MRDIIISFVLALMSFTRIPVPYKWFPFRQTDVNRSMMFFPLVGFVIGCICWIVWFLLHRVLPAHILVLFLIIIPILLTGAYHEDGFADVCDSYGGYTKKRRLAIMKDSRIGAFGAIGMVLLLLTKYTFLREIPLIQLPIVIMTALILGRLCIMLPFRLFPYGGWSKRSASILTIQLRTLFIAFITSIPILIFLLGIQLTLFLFAITQGCILVWSAYFSRRYGGLTGDVGGALEQIGEVVTYFLFMFIHYGTLSV